MEKSYPQNETNFILDKEYKSIKELIRRNTFSLYEVCENVIEKVLYWEYENGHETIVN
ncbi:hypothetical protein U3516DRAFT_747735 [Neocallimastix sp. 'constans']